ncbi:MAG: hypothetical protein DHS80DRAFT_29712 [Piptocephalis tieghemiana]|nr:MAG: hypothetical protein DHS80DRAFT_29712 [Piptocephalis tieghemiana]
MPSYLKFLGPEGRVMPWRTKFEQARDAWREDESVLENLQRILEFKSPQHAHLDEGEKASNTTLEKGMVECGICYASTWNPPEEMEMEEDRMTSNGGAMAIGSLQGPDQFCSHCERPFHHPCLSEWLLSTADTRISLGVMFGKCPYCAGRLECPVDRVAIE